MMFNTQGYVNEDHIDVNSIELYTTFAYVPITQ